MAPPRPKSRTSHISTPMTFRLPLIVAKALRSKRLSISSLCQDAVIEALKPHFTKAEVAHFETKLRELQEYSHNRPKRTVSQR